MSGPLASIRVVDLSSVVSGPVCTVTLADQGAEVIKVESLAGDQMRRGRASVAGLTPGFISCNRGKRSIALDLKCDAGHEVLWRLLADADVLVQNFRPGAIERLGFGEPIVRARHPGIIYVSISGVGASGPYAEWTALCTALGRPEWLEDPRFTTTALRSANRQERLRLVGDVLKTDTRSAWLDRLREAGVPCAPVLRRREVLDDPQVVSSSLVQTFRHGAAGEVRQARPAARFDRSPSAIRGPAPKLGEHFRPILAEIGYDQDAIEALLDSAVVKACEAD